jgi:hypothetical protein
VSFGDPGSRYVRKQQTETVEKQGDKLNYYAYINKTFVNQI